MSISEFLIARIAMDEEAIRFSLDCADPTTIAHEQMLADCAAKRRIVARHSLHPGNPNEPFPVQYATFRAGCDTLRLLAVPYADHPDYDETWRP